MDSLKNQGYKVNLKVFDTERSAEKMYTMVDEIDRFHPDLIIGPVYGSVYKALMDDLTNKNIPVFIPYLPEVKNLACILILSRSTLL